MRDLAYHLPDRFVQRRAVADLDEAGVGEQIVVALTVVEHRASPNNRAPLPRAGAGRAGQRLRARPISAGRRYTAKKLLPVGEKRWVAGQLEQYGQMLQIVHPDHVAEESAGLIGHAGASRSIALSEGLTQPKVAELVAAGARARARAARMDRAGPARPARSGPRGAMRCCSRTAASIRRRATGSPMTSCSPTASR